MDGLLRALQEKYPNCGFKAVMKDGKNVILFNDENLEWDEEFLDFIDTKIDQLLNKKEATNCIYSFDYLDVIKSGDVSMYYDKPNELEICDKSFKVFNIR